MESSRGYGHGEEGLLQCLACGRQGSHILDWPEDAYFKIDYRGRALWAHTRQDTQILRDFIASKERVHRGEEMLRHDGHRWVSRWRPAQFLRFVPSHFLTAKARDRVVKLLDRLLESTPGLGLPGCQTDPSNRIHVVLRTESDRARRKSQLQRRHKQELKAAFPAQEDRTARA
jgi:hypothetical protein